MAKKLIFTLLWMGAGFVASGILVGIVGPFLPKAPGVIDDQTPRNVKLVYASLALIPFTLVGACLFLGLLGKLPGTRRTAPK